MDQSECAVLDEFQFVDVLSEGELSDRGFAKRAEFRISSDCKIAHLTPASK